MGWHCKATGGYAVTSPISYYPDSYGLDNCDQIYYILRSKGWTTNAICGLITCIGLESRYNPWCWQGDVLPTTLTYNGAAGNKGYGLVQWDPGSYNNYDDTPPHQNKYIDNPTSIHVHGYGPNFADRVGSYFDGYAQIVWLDAHGSDQGDYYDSGNYYGHLEPTYAGFKTSTYQARDLCETWTQNFERAGGSYDPARRAIRQTLADALWSRYNGMPVIPPDKPPGNLAWLLFYMKAMNFGKGWI